MEQWGCVSTVLRDSFSSPIKYILRGVLSSTPRPEGAMGR